MPYNNNINNENEMYEVTITIKSAATSSRKSKKFVHTFTCDKLEKINQITQSWFDYYDAAYDNLTLKQTIKAI